MSTAKAEETATGGNILVADDDRMSLEILTNLLETNQFTVRSVTGGRDALKLASEQTFDAVLLDVVMPGLDGMEVCRQLKAGEATAHLPVILVTATADREALIAGIRAGADEFITKPYDHEEVVLRVSNAVRMKGLYDQVRESLSKLRELERLRDNMTHMIVHDMRNPLTVIMMSLGLMANDSKSSLSPGMQGSLKTCRDSSQYLASMIDALLDICKMESGTLKLKLVKCRIGKLIGGVMKMVGRPDHSAPVQFREPNPDIEVTCDEELVKRIVLNLLNNALKFTPTDGSITVEAVAEGPNVSVAVSDTGPGIPPEYHQRIFEKFGQAELGNEGKVRSIGLGLTFCKLASEAHGGRIELESRVGAGSKFIVTLPHRS